MKKIYLLILAFGFFSLVNAQTTIFSDNFESGSGSWSLNTATAPGGTSTSNFWIINNDYSPATWVLGTLVPATPSQVGSGVMPEDQNYLQPSDGDVWDFIGQAKTWLSNTF